jgi:hypothetical protein
MSSECYLTKLANTHLGSQNLFVLFDKTGKYAFRVAKSLDGSPAIPPHETVFRTPAGR